MLFFCRRLVSPPSSLRIPHAASLRKYSTLPNLEAKHKPQTTPANMAWNRILQSYAELRNPEAELGPDVVAYSNEKVLVIYDGYEKAKYHLLILREYTTARMSQLLFGQSHNDKDEDVPVAGKQKAEPASMNQSRVRHENTRKPDIGKNTLVHARVPFDTRTSSLYPRGLVSLEVLLKNHEKGVILDVLDTLKAESVKVEESIKKQMREKYGFAWDVQVGFHAVESMMHLHLHVISKDLISPRLKNKKHYNSFHPTLGFFRHIDDVISEVKKGTKSTNDKSHYESLLKAPLVSFYTNEEFKTIPKLKVHLEREWAKLKLRDPAHADVALVTDDHDSKHNIDAESEESKKKQRT